MKVTRDHAAVRAMFDRIDAAQDEAAIDTLREIQRDQAKLTGELRDSFDVSLDRAPGRRVRRLVISSSAVHADAVEWGANARVKGSVKDGTKRRGIYGVVDGKRKRVGWLAGPVLNRATRRGPHMQGNHVVANTGPRFLQHMSRRLRAGS